MKKPDSKIQELNQRLQKACGKNLLSVVLYGSAAREDFHEQFSDVNVLIVVNEMKPDSFVAMAPILQWWGHDEKLRPPLIMTLQELRESADVFAIELLDLQRSHQTLFGEDVVSAIEVPMNLHRVEVEHELRTTLLRLRHHLLLTRDNDADLRTVLAKSISTVLTLFRHALIAVGENPPHDKPKLLEHVGEVFGLEVRPVRTILQLRNDPALPMDVREHYYAYMNAIGHVAHELDVRQPKRHWQKKSGV